MCDYLGETLANFFGITTPKYQYEIDEYYRIIKEQKETQEKQTAEYSGWKSDTYDDNKQIINVDIEKQRF